MALFGKKDAEEATKEESKKVVAQTVTPVITVDRDITSVIVKPRITEKSALLMDKNVYTFEIRKNTTKYEVRDAIIALYKVTPISVRIVNKQPRHSMSSSRGRDMMEHGLRKAYVYLKKGDRINLV